MSMPSPYEMGARIGGNVGKGISGGLENNRIDAILQQAMQTGDPNQMNNIMNQIGSSVSPEKRPMVMEALKNRQQQLVQQQQQQQQQAYYQSQGIDPRIASLDPGTRKQIMASQSARELETMRGNTKKEIAAQKLAAATTSANTEVYNNTISEMEKLIKYTGSQITPFTKSFGGPVFNRSALEKRNKFNTLAISLEGLFRDKLTKGQMSARVFEALLARLPSADLSERANKGRLSAIKSILGSSEKKAKEQVKENSTEELKSEKPSLGDIWK